MPYNPTNAPLDFGESLSATAEGLKKMDKPTLANLLKAAGPLLSYYFLSGLEMPNPDQLIEGRVELKAEVDRQKLRAQVGPIAPFLMAEKPPEAKTPKTPEEITVENDLKARGYVLDEITGNYLNPRIFNLDRLRNDPLLSYEFHDESGPVTCYFRLSFGRRLQEADRRMFEATGRHLIFNSSFRSNGKQWAINEDSTVHTKAQVGQSQHEAGLAADIQNWEEAQDYLKDEGVYGGKYKNLTTDRVHFDTRMG